MGWALFIFIFISVILFLLGIYYLIEYGRQHRKLISRLKEERVEENNQTLPKFSRGRPFLNAFAYLGKFLYPKKEGDLSLIKQKFLLAGLRRENTLLLFLGGKVFCALCLFIFVVLIKTFFVQIIPINFFMFLSIASALIGFYLPNLWLRTRIAKRKDMIFRAFPDALDMMVVCVEAGMGLDAAINRVGEEINLSHPVLGEELKLINLELRSGKNRQEALRNLAYRTDLEDVNSLVGLLIQTDKFGTSMAQALRVYSDSMRTKRYQRAEEIAAKLGTKLIFPLVLCLFPAIIVVAAGPAFILLIKVLSK